MSSFSEFDWDKLFPNDTDHPDVSALLQQMASTNEEDREAAALQLEEGVFARHPQVIPVIIPFLIQLVETGNPDVASDALDLLVGIIGGAETDSRRDMGQGYDILDQPDLVKLIHDAFRRGLPSYLRRLADPDPELRAVAADALAAAHVQKTVSSLREQLESEANPRARARMLRAFGILAPSDALPVALSHLTSTDSLTKLQAAATVAEIMQPRVPEEVLRILVELSVDPLEKDWLRQNAFVTLTQLGPFVFERAVEEWLVKLSDPPTGIGDYARFLVRSVFQPSPSIRVPSSPASLNNVQRKVLQALLTYPNVWEVPDDNLRSNIYSDLDALGLPASRQDLAAFLT